MIKNCDNESQRRRIKELENDLVNYKKLKSRLKVAEQHLETLTKTTPTYVCEINSKGQITFVNRTYEGLDIDQVLGSKLIEWFPQELHNKINSLMNEVFVDLKSRTTSYTIPDPKGILRSYAAEIIPFQKEDNKDWYAFYLATDITDQINLERSLKEKEYYLNQAQSISQIGHWRLNPISDQVEGSDELFRIFGLKRNEASLENFLRVVHPEDREMDLYYIKKGMEKGEPWDIRHRLLLDDGSQKTVHAKGEVKKDKHGEVTLLIGTVQDITKKALLEEVLKKSENRFKSLASSTPNLVFTVDSDGKILYMNRTPDGININDIIGSSMYTHMEPEYHDIVKNHVNDVFEHGRSSQFQCSGLGPFGKTSDYLSNIGPVFGTLDDVISCIVSAQDITEIEHMQHLLLESEKTYKILIETIVNGVQEIDLSGKIISANSAYHHMLGYENEALIGTSMYQTQPEKKAQNKLIEYIDYLIKEQPDPVPWFDRIVKKNGHIIDTQTDWNYKRNANGEVIGFVSIISDITEQKRMEEQIKNNNAFLEIKVKERTSALEDMNAALTVLLNKRDEDNNETEQRIISNYRSLIEPFCRKLKSTLTLSDQKNLMMILEGNLKEFLHPFSKKLSVPLVNLTPMEIQIASMIKQGLSNKEIAKTLNNSIRTITNHRQHIRTKLKLKNKKINLRSHLSSL